MQMLLLQQYSLVETDTVKVSFLFYRNVIVTTVPHSRTDNVKGKFLFDTNVIVTTMQRSGTDIVKG